MKAPIQLILNRQQCRMVDKFAIEQFGVPGIVLMENAGRGCAELLLAEGCVNAVICCGPGNNGGDGFVIARHLENHGVPTKVLMCCDPEKISGDALINYQIHIKSNQDIEQADPNWDLAEFKSVIGNVKNEKTQFIVDCLLGTGSHGDPRPPIDHAIRAANGLLARRIAIDLPSGLDCDSGQPGDPTFQADITCTFVAEKIGFNTDSARKCLGRVHVVDIGIPKRVLQQLLQSG